MLPIEIDNKSCLNDHMIEELVNFIVDNTSIFRASIKSRNSIKDPLQLGFLDDDDKNDYFISHSNNHREVLVWPTEHTWSTPHMCQMIAHEIAEWLGLSHADMNKCDSIDNTPGRLAGDDSDIDCPTYWDRMFEFNNPPNPLYWKTDFHKLNPHRIKQSDSKTVIWNVEPAGVKELF